jgi:protein TonB
MHTHGDIFDRPDRVTGSFWGSVGLHVGVAATLLAYAAAEANRRPIMGDANGGGMGSVAVTAVHTIPLPSRHAPENPVANPTESYVPTPPPKTKAQPKVKAPEPKAIQIPDKTAPRKQARQPEAAPNKFREKQVDQPNQVYSHVGPGLSSDMYQMRGAGGVGIGNNNPLGQQFGTYASLIIRQVSQRWNTSSLNPRIQTAPTAVITFVINRDGSVAPASVKIAQSSGIGLLDISAQRAVMDAAPFPQLPPGFPRSDAQIELHFELRR